MAGPAEMEELWRRLAPQVLAAVVRRYGDFQAAEDAVQEAMISAASQWRADGLPDNPKAWLITAASRRLIDRYRNDEARRRREATVATMAPAHDYVVPGPDADDLSGTDDALTLLLLCCHPSLTPPSQIALTLRAVGGLSTAQIARAFMVPEPTIAQRISRAKQTIRNAGARFVPPPAAELAERMKSVLQVLYLIFNEGYTSVDGSKSDNVVLTREAIWLTRSARTLLPDDGEVAGLLAIMLINEGRRAARTGPGGILVPISEQDRALWDRPLIDEGISIISESLSRAALGPYQLQAAIAAVHAEAPTAESTDWLQIRELYAVLELLAPNPMVTLSRAVAEAMVEGPAVGLAILETLASDPQVGDHHRLHAVRGHLLELAGDYQRARESYLRAGRRTTSLAEKNYLEERAEKLQKPEQTPLP